MQELHNENSTLIALIITINLSGLAVRPIIFATVSEIFGRLIVQHVRDIGGLLTIMGASQATSVNVLLVTMFSNEIFTGSAMTSGGSIVADMMKQENRGRAIAVVMFELVFHILWFPIFGAFAGPI